MRPFIALYVGGMGSRDKNFYNKLVQRYGFEDAAKQVQDLYLEGKRDEAMAALPDELIDLVSLAGPADKVRDRLRVYREAGVGTLGVTPMAWTKDERIEQLRKIAELAGRLSAAAVLLGAFGDPGHAFPVIALGRGLVRARPRRHAPDVGALAGRGERRGDGVRPGARVPRLPHARAAAEALRGRGPGGAVTRELVREVRRTRWSPTS